MAGADTLPGTMAWAVGMARLGTMVIVGDLDGMVAIAPIRPTMEAVHAVEVPLGTQRVVLWLGAAGGMVSPIRFAVATLMVQVWQVAPEEAQHVPSQRGLPGDPVPHALPAWG